MFLLLSLIVILITAGFLFLKCFPHFLTDNQTTAGVEITKFLTEKVSQIRKNETDSVFVAIKVIA